MAVSIRLRREGAKNRPYYKVVVADSRSPRDGKFIEIIGTYDPKKTDHNSTLKLDRIEHWVSKGARPSDTVRSLIKKNQKVAAGARRSPLRRRPNSSGAASRDSPNAAAPSPGWSRVSFVQSREAYVRDSLAARLTNRENPLSCATPPAPLRNAEGSEDMSADFRMSMPQPISGPVDLSLAGAGT